MCQKKGITPLVLLIIDTVVISVSWISAYWIRHALDEAIGIKINEYHPYLYSLPMIIAAWLLTAGSFGFYRRKKKVNMFEDIHALLMSVLLGSLIVMSIAFLFKELDIGRLVILFFVIMNFISFGIVRFTVRGIERIWAGEGYNSVPTLIIGSGVTGVMAMQKLIDHPETGYNIVGFIDEAPEKVGTNIGGVPVLGTLNQIKEILNRFKIEEVFIALPTLDHKKILELMVRCEECKVNFKVVTDLFEVISNNTDIEVIDGFPIVDLGIGEISPLYESTRRLFDIVISIFGIILVLPLWIIIAILIKIDSSGGIFFVHERVGKGGRLFKLYKFRTMRKDAGKYEISPSVPNDNRITRLGRFLRKTSIDETPQLINVLKGEMSIVGPRPEMPFIVAKYEDWQRKRLEVTPGITGLWQVIGRKDLPLHENLEYDFYYIKNRSLLLDLTILIKTIPAILFKRGAY